MFLTFSLLCHLLCFLLLPQSCIIFSGKMRTCGSADPQNCNRRRAKLVVLGVQFAFNARVSVRCNARTCVFQCQLPYTVMLLAALCALRILPSREQDLVVL